MTNLVFGGSNRFRKGKKRNGKIQEAILVVLNLGLGSNELVELQADETSDKGGGGGNGRDDLPRDPLDLVSITCRN